MTILAISDIHGSLHYLKKALKVFHSEGAELLLILGDELYHGPRNPLPEGYNPKEVAELLNTYKDRIIAVRGNCDSEVDQMVLDYPITSDISQLIWEGRRIIASHGHIYSEDKLPPMSHGNIFIYGHTHIPVAHTREGVFILNPGSISLPKGGFDPSYGIFKDGSFKVKSFTGEIIEEISFKVEDK